MRVLKPGQKVQLTPEIEGTIRCVTIYSDLSTLYECRWWTDGEPDVAKFSRDEIEPKDDPEYLTIQGE